MEASVSSRCGFAFVLLKVTFKIRFFPHLTPSIKFRMIDLHDIVVCAVFRLALLQFDKKELWVELLYSGAFSKERGNYLVFTSYSGENLVWFCFVGGQAIVSFKLLTHLCNHIYFWFDLLELIRLYNHSYKFGDFKP